MVIDQQSFQLSTVQHFIAQSFSLSPSVIIIGLNHFPASGDFCLLLITFANSLDPDQVRQYPICLTLMVFLKSFLKMSIFKKQSTDDKKACKITQHAKSYIVLKGTENTTPPNSQGSCSRLDMLGRFSASLKERQLW